jgi:hypothetical protein
MKLIDAEELRKHARPGKQYGEMLVVGLGYVLDAEDAGKAFWTSAKTKPEGCERKILCWVVWPKCGRPSPPEPIIGWWKHGPGCFALESVEHANHLVTHWAEIPEPNTIGDSQSPGKEHYEYTRKQ